MEGAARPRVLWISDELPDRSLGGGNIRQAHLLESLGARAEVTLVLLGSLADDQVRAALHEVIEVPDPGVPAPRVNALRRLHDLWIAARGPREVVLTARRRRRVRRVVRDLEPRASVVVASHLGMAALRPRRPRARWVAQLHHVSSAKARQEAAVTPGRRQRWLLQREEVHATSFERGVLAGFDDVIVVSAEDASLLGLGPDVIVAPNGVDVARYRPAPLPSEPVVVMTGSYQYRPNAEGAVWFCAEVLPLVQAAVPGVSLLLVGREPLPEVRALAGRPGVTLHADVPDVAPFLAAGRVAVVPLRIGTGTRLKALEAMAAGRPVVGTSVGLEGLELVDGVHALLADDAQAMAAAVVRLLTDDLAAIELADAGRHLVEERYRWSAIGDRLADDLLQGP